MEENSNVCPGTRLFSATHYLPGDGTYLRNTHIFSSVAGSVQLAAPKQEGQRPVVEILRSGAKGIVPGPGDIVISKITRVNTRGASASLQCVNGQVLSDTFTGVIRQQDVRAAEIDKVELYSCFRPGDLVRAEVVGLGDARSFYLSTAKNALGVVHAKSAAGESMIPLSWLEMQCPKTKVTEKRKVARTT